MFYHDRNRNKKRIGGQANFYKKAKISENNFHLVTVYLTVTVFPDTKKSSIIV